MIILPFPCGSEFWAETVATLQTEGASLSDILSPLIISGCACAVQMVLWLQAGLKVSRVYPVTKLISAGLRGIVPSMLGLLGLYLEAFSGSSGLVDVLGPGLTL